MSTEVIETFFLDWPFCFAAGLLFSMAGAREIARARSPYKTAAFRTGFAYTQAGLLGIGIVFYALRPDWMWMYWVESARIPVVVVVLCFAMYEVAFLAGFALGPVLAARVKTTIAATAICLGAAEYAPRTRLLHLGSLEGFTAGEPAEIAFSPFHVTGMGWAVLAIVPLSAAALILLALRVARRPVA